ncbi:MAG: hypothetical protein QE278_12800 [Limnobacter sp.]|nr:hypothetical protein [Limnobacter sp.]
MTIRYQLIVCLLALGTLSAVGLAFALSDEETRYQLQCMTTGLKPRVELIDAPVEIGTEWKVFPIPENVKRLPTLEYIEITGSNLHHQLTEDLPALLPNDLSLRLGLLDTRTNKVSLFSVKVIDDKGREVRLSQNSWLSSNHTNPPSPSPGFGLTHSGWNKSFFSPEAKLRYVAVRTSYPIVIERLAWTLSGYCKWPNRTWDSIPESERYNFETPSPATGELVEGDPYGLKERARRTLPK